MHPQYVRPIRDCTAVDNVTSKSYRPLLTKQWWRLPEQQVLTLTWADQHSKKGSFCRNRLNNSLSRSRVCTDRVSLRKRRLHRFSDWIWQKFDYQLTRLVMKMMFPGTNPFFIVVLPLVLVEDQIRETSKPGITAMQVSFHNRRTTRTLLTGIRKSLT